MITLVKDQPIASSELYRVRDDGDYAEEDLVIAYYIPDPSITVAFYAKDIIGQ